MRSTHLAILTCALASAPAVAAAASPGWNGVLPGVTTESDARSKFGAPSSEGHLPNGRVALLYRGDQAIPGTRQVQFILRDDGVIGQVNIFPATQLDREAVEGKYGKPTKKSFTDDFKDIWIWKGSGVTVFFGKEGYVDAITYDPVESAAAPAPRAPAAKPAAQAAPPPAKP